ncbi:MAG: thiol oxidoreductase [Acidobacteria bacterium]|nr:thiol oxidoreductase [Acidobacteriota bacterium]
MSRINGLVGTTVGALGALLVGVHGAPAGAQPIGSEVAVTRHLEDGQEFVVSKQALIKHGADLFNAMWTIEEGGGRPLTKGVGSPLADPSSPLVFPRNFNRISAPDANSCAGCHNLPASGGGGDIVANVFVLGQRFDFATFDSADGTPTRGGVDENGDAVELQNIANSRATLGMNGSGYIEMLARQMTADLQSIRDGIMPGGSAELVTKGVSFGTLARNADGSWDASGAEGLPAPSLATSGPSDPPNLILRPFHQAGAVISLRQFTNNAFNHHHGIQSTERFGVDTDPDGDGFMNEMTVADVTAASVWQATLNVPGRVIPRVRAIEEAVLTGEQKFADVGCATCHVPELPLDNGGWFYTEPNPYNPAGNLQPGDAPDFVVNLNSKILPEPRLRAVRGVTMVPAFTDLKLHDITSGPNDPNREALDMQQPAGSAAFFAGNSYFLTKKLWGAANERPYFHHGQYTTLRQAILAHAGEAEDSRISFEALSDYEQGSIIEFLKTLQVLPRGTKSLVVDENMVPRAWPPRGGVSHIEGIASESTSGAFEAISEE